MRIGFVGAGGIGLPMVQRLRGVGHEVSVLARSAGVAAQLNSIGARPVNVASELAAQADVVIVCVLTDAQVRQVCIDDRLLDAMRPGSTLVVHTTGSPETAQLLEALASQNGVAVIDAPVSGGPDDVADGAITLFVGGADEDVERVRPVLASYANPVLHVGACGAGQRVKLVNNALFAATISLVADGVRIGGGLGVDEGTLLAALQHGSAASRALATAARFGSVAFLSESAGK